jgi:tetratricopeptide (TPR) repeat protein
MTDSEAERQSGTHSIAGDASGNVVQASNINGNVYFRSAEPAHVVPRQLRPPPANFTNRAEELAELARITLASPERRGPAVAVISGPGGVGKSALALRWFADTADRYPDGQLYVDLTVGSGPAPMDAILGALLRALGVAPERIPVDVGEAAALFRSVTAGKRLAMLLDNVLSTAQVRTLLPASPDCVVVVASRWRLGGLAMDGAGFIVLVPMATGDGVELLARTVGAERAARERHEVERLVGLCGGFPLALTIAGARLAMRPGWRVERVVRDLTDERRRLSALVVEQRELSVHGVFDLSYAALSPAEAGAYRWLGLHPGPSFRVETAAAALGVPDADDLVEALVDASLLEVADDRYRFHDLVRLHARELSEHVDSRSDRAEVLRRTMTHYLVRAAGVSRLVIPLEWQLGPVFQSIEPLTGSTEVAALDGLSAELPNVMAALSAGVEAGLDDLVWQLCEAMYVLFLYRKHFPDWIAAHRLAIAAAQRCGDQVVVARLHRRLGLAFHNLNESATAVEHGEAALVSARAAGHERAESEALRLIGIGSRALGQHDDAVVVLARSADLTGRLGFVRDEGITRRTLGQTLAAAGRFAEAIVELTTAQDRAAEVADATGVAVATIWLADALTRAGRPVEALDALPAAWATLRVSGSAQYRAHVLMVWGEAAAAAGDPAAAREHLTRARDLYAELGLPHVGRAQRALDAVP